MVSVLLTLPMPAQNILLILEFFWQTSWSCVVSNSSLCETGRGPGEGLQVGGAFDVHLGFQQGFCFGLYCHSFQ